MNPDNLAQGLPSQRLSEQMNASDLAARSLDDLGENLDGEMFLALFEQSNLGKAMIDGEARLQTVNETLCSLLGYSRSELSGKSLLDCLKDADRQLVGTAIEQLAAGRLESYRSEKSLCHREGQLLAARLHLVRLDDLEGGPSCLLLELQDISRETQEEAGWQTEHERLKRAEQLANVYYSSMDQSTQKGYWSPEMYELFGLNESFVPSFETTQALFEPSEAEHMSKTVHKILSDYQPATISLRIIRPDGSRRIIRGAYEMLRGTADGGDTLICYLMDITPFCEQLAQLQQSNQALTAQNMQLRRLTELVDDSLTDPLSGLLTASEQSGHPELDLLARRGLEELQAISQELYETRSLDAEILPVSLEIACQRVIQMLEPEIDGRQVYFNLDLSSWNFIELVPFYLDILLFHLIRGTLLLPAEGRLTIRLKSEYEADGLRTLVYDVKGADLVAAFEDAGSDFGQIKALLESRGGNLRFTQPPAGSTALQIQL